MKQACEDRMLIDMETLERIAPVIRSAAHPLRQRILDYFAQAGEPRSVTQIVEAAGALQAIVSQRLRILKDQGVLNARRDRGFVLYGIANRSVLFLLNCIRDHQSPA